MSGGTEKSEDDFCTLRRCRWAAVGALCRNTTTKGEVKLCSENDSVYIYIYIYISGDTKGRLLYFASVQQVAWLQ